MAKELDDNLMLALGKLPKPQGEGSEMSMKGFKDDLAKLEAFKSLSQAIFKSASVSISSAAKAVVPNIPKAIADITQEIERGPINNFDKSLEKLNNLVSNLGINLEDYNKELAQFLKDREEKIVESEKKVEQLRIQNVVSEVNRITGEVNILSKKEIDEKKKNVEYLTRLIQQEEKALNNNRKVLQEKKGLSDKEIETRKIFINEQTQKVTELKEQREREYDVLGRPEEAEGGRRGIFGGGDSGSLGGADRYVPAPLMDIFSSIKEGFMAPINAVKEIGSTFMEFAKPLRLVVDLFKPLLGFLKKFVAGLAKSVIAFLPYLAIGALVIAALYGLYKAVQRIAGFFGFGKEGREKEKIDKQEGRGKYQSLDEGTYDVIPNEEPTFTHRFGPPEEDSNTIISKAQSSIGPGTKRTFMETKGYARRQQGDKISPEALKDMREKSGMGGNTIINAPTQQVNQNSTNNLPNLDGSTNTELWYNRSAQGAF